MKILLLTVLTMFAISAKAQEGHDRGGGGAGIIKNGQYMTFYSAGLYTELQAEKYQDIPQMKELVEFLKKDTLMTVTTRSKYLAAVLPTAGRTYYKVKSDTFTAEAQKSILDEYMRVMKLDLSNRKNLVLMAVTVPETKTTYLFPEYYKLSPVDQRTILLHENYWIVHPEASYEQVLRAETTTQAYFENLNSPEKMFKWIKAVGDSSDATYAALKLDQESGALKGLLAYDRLITLDSLFGDSYYTCLKEQGLYDQCVSFIKINMYALLEKYPNSFFLKIFADRFERNKISWTEAYRSTKHELWTMGPRSVGYGIDIANLNNYSTENGLELSAYIDMFKAIDKTALKIFIE